MAIRFNSRIIILHFDGTTLIRGANKVAISYFKYRPFNYYFKTFSIDFSGTGDAIWNELPLYFTIQKIQQSTIFTNNNAIYIAITNVFKRSSNAHTIIPCVQLRNTAMNPGMGKAVTVRTKPSQ